MLGVTPIGCEILGITKVVSAKTPINREEEMMTKPICWLYKGWLTISKFYNSIIYVVSLWFH